MLSTQEKIDRIYEILSKQESRYQGKFWISTFFRIIALGFVFLIIFYPSVITGFLSDMIMPVVKETVESFVNSQKEVITEKGGELLEKAKQFYETHSSGLKQ